MSSYAFDKVAWRRMGLFDQMGNIGMEVGRALRAKRSGDQQNMTGALYRGLDLLDATVENLTEQRSPRVREVLRARELFVQTIITTHEDPGLEDYFMHFAFTARLHR
jgi:hypothetical protein